MNNLIKVSAILSIALMTACASAPPPQPDPLKEQMTVLQKQLLELQKVQSDTKQQLDTSTATIDSLNMKVKALEEKRPAAVSAPPSENKPAPTVQAEPEKKPAPAKKPVKKKKKKVRRQ